MNDNPFFNLVLEAYTSNKRHSTIFDVESSINASGAWITDFNSLSEKLINFIIECEYEKYMSLYENLIQTGIKFYDYSKEQLKELPIKKIKGDLLISLSIHFMGGEKGDLGTRIDNSI